MYILPLEGRKSGEIKFDGSSERLNAMVDAKYLFEFMSDSDGKPRESGFRAYVWQSKWPSQAQEQLDAGAEAGSDARLVWVMANEQYAALAERAIQEADIYGVDVMTVEEWLEWTERNR